MGKRRTTAVLPTNIILLQNVVRKDPDSYKEEFLQQYSHYESLRDIFLLDPTASNDSSEFSDLIGFVSAVCSCYPQETSNFPAELKQLISSNHRDLKPELREKIIQCLTMLRNRKIISSESLIQTLFPLLIAYSSKTPNVGLHAKQLRKQVYTTLISLLKNVNTGTKNQKLNRSTQALLFNLLEEESSNSQGLWATKVTRELWRRGIWDDSRTVEIMTQAALHLDPKVSIAGVKFFLGADKEREEAFEEESDDEDIDISSLKHKLQMNKKSGKRSKKIEAAAKQLKKKSSAKHSATYLNFSAIHLLRDPQGFAEALFDNHLSSKNVNKFDLDQKILLMNLISRLIGTHKLTVLGIYSFFLKYLTPKQRNVTQILAASAQASHDLVPPESINTVVRKIADEFVSDGVAAEVASAGINTIREILARAPLAIDSTLLQDLTEYKGSKSKPVMMAARSLISLYREVAPEMLLKKDRGKVASIELQRKERSGLPQFGVESGTTTSIPGLELLAKWRKEQGLTVEDEDEEAWNVKQLENSDEDDDEDEGDWIDVKSDGEINLSGDELKAANDEDSDLDLSDSEEPPKKKQAVEKEKSEQDAMTQLLTSRVLTPADFAKLKELTTESGIEKMVGSKKLHNEEEVDSTTLVGASKFKQLREERIAHAKEGRTDEKHGSRKGNRDPTTHSTTNREKARKKNFVMMIHKRQVQGKQKMSLRDRQKVLQAHITKQKKKGF